MNRYYYDLHVHSCLSPCADNDSTPYNIAGMAALSGINIMALTDHNSCKNCPAFFDAARKNGIIPVAGMELTTAEDIHIVCLFPVLSDAMEFGAEIDRRRVLIENNTAIFGDQIITGEDDKVLGTEKYLLSNATTVTLDEAPEIVARFGGICYPAHIDREANGIIATLGTLPDKPVFNCVELHDGAKTAEYSEKYGLAGKTVIVSSDAHYLWDIRDKENFFLLPDEPYSSDFVRAKLFEKLRG